MVSMSIAQPYGLNLLYSSRDDWWKANHWRTYRALPLWARPRALAPMEIMHRSNVIWPRQLCSGPEPIKSREILDRRVGVLPAINV